jgi:type III restriction enzyme
VQTTKEGEINWIIETKGRVWEGTTAKDEAMREWCERVSTASGNTWHYCRIDQTPFDAATGKRLADLVDGHKPVA